MRNKLFTLLGCSLLLGGCQFFAGQSTATATGPVVRLQGELSRQQDQWQLTACDDNQTHTLEFSTAWQQPLEICLQDGVHSCFADLEFLPVTTNEPALASHIHRVLHEGHGCMDEEFQHLHIKAFGNEPFWNIRLNHQGLVLQQPGQQTVALPYIHEQLGDGLQLISSQADRQSLKLWVSPHACIDDMSGAWFALSARLEWQGQILNGCAYYGAQHTTLP